LPSATNSLSLHDALPIWIGPGFDHAAKVLKVDERSGAFDAEQFLGGGGGEGVFGGMLEPRHGVGGRRGMVAHEQRALIADLALQDRKSTRLNSSHVKISY